MGPLNLWNRSTEENKKESGVLKLLPIRNINIFAHYADHDVIRYHKLELHKCIL